MNNRGQAAIVGLMIGVMVFMLAMIFVNPLSDVITETRNSSQLDCSNTSISDGHKGACLITDLILPYFLIAVLAVGAGWISSRVVG